MLLTKPEDPPTPWARLLSKLELNRKLRTCGVSEHMIPLWVQTVALMSRSDRGVEGRCAQMLGALGAEGSRTRTARQVGNSHDQCAVVVGGRAVSRRAGRAVSPAPQLRA